MFEKCIVLLGRSGAGKTELALNILGTAASCQDHGALVFTHPENDSEKASRLQKTVEDNRIAYLPIEACLSGGETVDELQSLPMVVFDVGDGPDEMAKLSSFLHSPTVSRASFRIYYVFNGLDPDSHSPSLLSSDLRRTQKLLGTSIDGIINNSHSGADTTWQHVLFGADLADKAAKETCIPLFGTAGSLSNVFYAAHQFSPRPSGAFIHILPVLS